MKEVSEGISSNKNDMVTKSNKKRFSEKLVFGLYMFSWNICLSIQQTLGSVFISFLETYVYQFFMCNVEHIELHECHETYVFVKFMI